MNAVLFASNIAVEEAQEAELARVRGRVNRSVEGLAPFSGNLTFPPPKKSKNNEMK